MFRGPPGVAVFMHGPACQGFQSLLLLRLGFQTVLCCVLGTWFEWRGSLTFSRAVLPELRAGLLLPSAGVEKSLLLCTVVSRVIKITMVKQSTVGNAKATDRNSLT